MQFLPLWPYTRAALVSEKRLDPINLVFAGKYAAIAEVRRIIVDELGLKTDKLVSDQYFYEPLTPLTSHRQDYNQSDSLFSGFSGRFHTRVYQVFTEDKRIGGRFVASPIHIDKWSWCGDAADSFDLARDWAVDKLRKAGYEAAYLGLAPPDVVTQCDGRATPWDGRTAVVAEADFLRKLRLDVSPSP